MPWLIKVSLLQLLKGYTVDAMGWEKANSGVMRTRLAAPRSRECECISFIIHHLCHSTCLP
eukprot:scaffold3955_cov160-Cylindrotheca_fusiformis.AAC.6